MTSCTRASPKALAFSSGTYSVTGACGSILPSATRMPASTPVNDFVTDIAICGLCGFNAPK
jgi:hypothetical protein